MDRMSLLPTIKCSSCGIDIDILQLADHVCGAAPPSTASAATPMSPDRPKLERAATFGSPSFSNRSDRPGRMPPPPRIDSNAANQPFRPLEPAPMTNYSDTRTRSPPSHAPPPKAPYIMNRSVTAPAPKSTRRPSPELPSNLDCAFPPFPNTRATAEPMRLQNRDRLEPTYQHTYAEPSPLFAPRSPRTNGGENVARRMDTISPGPFDGTSERRPSTANAPKSPARDEPVDGHKRTHTQDSTKSSGRIQSQRAYLTSNSSRSSAASNRSVGLPSRPKPNMNGANDFSPPRLPSTSGPDGIDAFLERLQEDTIKSSQARQDSGAAMHPVRQDSRERREPPPRPRRPSERDLPSPDMMSVNSTAFPAPPNSVFPLRKQSRSDTEAEVQKDAAPYQALRPPPLAASAFANDTPLNPLHTPSDSGLSDDSYASSGFRSLASSRSSPPGSVIEQSRGGSKLNRSEHIAEETFERAASPESYAESRPTRGPGSYVKPSGHEGIPRALSPGYANFPESPMDPAIQMGAAFRRFPEELMFSSEPVLDNGRSLPRMPDPEPQQLETRRPKPASKGNCRGCSEPIFGKSVKDSSGRLTGRYHKQCFVCRTCADPFPTAEFYVFDNSPYCEQHYHKLNGSLCGSCNRGIEGQYLETDMRQKFHPRCFTCSTCRVVLRDGYFDVGGRRYCDRHAQSAAAPPRNYLGGGGYKPRNLQKRGTRLMMMA